MSFTGWIAPDRTFIECRYYGHIQGIFDKIQEDLGLGHLLDHLEAVRQECQHLEDTQGSGNAEWHCLESAESNARFEIYNELLDRGYVRVGTSRNTIHFEGRPTVLEAKKIELQDFAQERDCNWEFEPFKKETE